MNSSAGESFRRKISIKGSLFPKKRNLRLDFGNFGQLQGSKTPKQYNAEKSILRKGTSLACLLSDSINQIIQLPIQCAADSTPFCQLLWQSCSNTTDYTYAKSWPSTEIGTWK